MHKIFVFANTTNNNDWFEGLALAEDGYVLAEHTSSSVYWLQHDLGHTSNWQHKKYDAHFGKDNWETVFIEHDAILSTPEVMEAYRLNQLLKE